MLDHFMGRMLGESGTALLEYALLLALVTAVSLGTLNIIGIKMVNVFKTIAYVLP